MSDEQQGEGKRMVYFGDATAGVPTMTQELQQQQEAQKRIEAFGKDLQAVIEKHNGDMHFCATDPDILSEYILSTIAVFKFSTQSRDYRLFQRMSSAAAKGKVDL